MALNDPTQGPHNYELDYHYNLDEGLRQSCPGFRRVVHHASKAGTPMATYCLTFLIATYRDLSSPPASQFSVTYRHLASLIVTYRLCCALTFYRHLSSRIAILRHLASLIASFLIVAYRHSSSLIVSDRLLS
jgi:hypothetical protein